MTNSLKDLDKIINSYIVEAIQLTQDEIYKILKEKVDDYYSEPVFNSPDKETPVVYRRSYKLRDSLMKSEITQGNNGYFFTVGFSDEYLAFHYPGNTKWDANVSATGQDVLEWFNAESHGGTIEGSHQFWDEALSEIDGKYGGLLNLFKQNCIKVGIPII